MIALVQISTMEKDAIIDPFPDFNGLRKLMGKLMQGDNLKIFCGGDNDFINIYRIFEVIPEACVDIQLLDCRMTGSRQPRGLKALCQEYLKTDIPKGESNRDWRRRPLPKEMLTYAQGDSYYCMAIFYEMTAKVCRFHLL